MSRRERNLRIVAVLVAVGIAVTLALVLSRRSAPGAPAAGTSAAATAWILPSLDGSGTVSLHGFAGKPLVVDLFASWCTACRGELPGFLHLQQSLGSRIIFAGVDSEENGDGAGFARELGITSWPLARDIGTRGQDFHDALGQPGMPVTAFYSGDGRLLLVADGAMDEPTLRQHISELFGIS